MCIRDRCSSYISKKILKNKAASFRKKIPPFFERKICMKKDTIAAIATAMSNSGIGIVRISGEESFDIIQKIYRGKTDKNLRAQKSHTIHYGYIVDGEEMIDEVLVMLMKGPHSFTGEDTGCLLYTSRCV